MIVVWKFGCRDALIVIIGRDRFATRLPRLISSGGGNRKGSSAKNSIICCV